MSFMPSGCQRSVMPLRLVRDAIADKCVAAPLTAALARCAVAHRAAKRVLGRQGAPDSYISLSYFFLPSPRYHKNPRLFRNWQVVCL